MRTIHINPDDLVIQSTIAFYLGVTKQAVGNWINRNPAYLRGRPDLTPIPFPPPALTIDGVDFWDWPTVKEWAIKSGKASA